MPVILQRNNAPPGNIQGGSNGVKKCDMEDPNVGESIIGFKMDINNMQCYHIE